MSFFRKIFQEVSLNPLQNPAENRPLIPVVCCDVFGTILLKEGGLRPGFTEFLTWLQGCDDVQLELVSSDPQQATRALRAAGLPEALYPQGVSLKESALARLERAGQIAVVIDDEPLLATFHDVAYSVDPQRAAFAQFLREARYKTIETDQEEAGALTVTAVRAEAHLV